MIRLHLLGPLTLKHEDGTSVASVVAQPKRLALLVCLAAVYPPGSRSRDTLAALLWPELDQERARKGLRQALFGLRRSLGKEAFTSAGDERVGVDPDRLWCDAAAFSAALERGAAAEALALYGGPFLDGFHLAGALEFERWVEQERRRLEQGAVRAAWQLARSAEVEDDRAAARRWAERAVALAPYDEEGFRSYLGVLDRQADRAAAVTAFAAYQRRMAEDLGLEPSAETTAVIERIRRCPETRLSPRSAMPPAGPQPETAAASARQPLPSDRERQDLSALPPEGAAAEAAIGGSSSGRRHGWSGHRARVVTVALGVGAVALFGWGALVARRPGALTRGAAGAQIAPGSSDELGTAGAAAPSLSGTEIPAKSIAVLPFENLSADPENAYFAAGIQDEILTDLAHVSDVEVISRESVMQYADHPAAAGTISRRLRVANLLEGSVQREGHRIRISVQLIDARRDAHIWAATYDREVRDVFAIESDVARRIAAALEAELTPEEAHRLGTPPTANAAAYRAYLRGLAFATADQLDAAHLQAAALAYERAVALDPTFALAWARLSEEQSLTYFLYDRTPERLAASRRAAERAVALAPDVAETQLALGQYYYQGRRDYARARAAFERALQLLPNGSDEWASLSYVERRQGRWADAIAHAQHALLLDPLNHFLLSEAASTYIALRQYPAALELLNRALEASPGDPESLTDAAAVYEAEGDLAHADSLLAGARILPTSRFDFTKLVTQRMYTREYAAAIQILQAALATPGLSAQWPLGEGVLREQLAFAEQLAGRATAARADYERARRALQGRLVEEPDNPVVYAWLGRAEAGLGHREAALTAGRRAVALLPARTDALWGPGYEENLARIQARVGDADDAIATIRRLLAVPYSNPFMDQALTPALLRVDPVWDGLRGDRRFQALAGEVSGDSWDPAPGPARPSSRDSSVVRSQPSEPTC